MKKFNLLFITILILGLGVFNSCDKEDDEEIIPLIGTWEMATELEGVSIALTMTFNQDYTGMAQIRYTLDEVTESETESFTYSVNGNTLTMEIEGESETATFTISGNQLIINAEDEILILTKQ